jgi:Kef-type K+ transport system membrane component KefB
MNELAKFLHITPWPLAADWLLWVSLTLIGGALLGEAVFRWLGLPRIAGYSAAGMAAGAAGLGLGGGELHGATRLVVDLGLALLLFELGSRVSIRWLRANPALLWTSALESIVSFAAIFAVLLFLDFDRNFALACAALTTATSGAVIARVSAELKSAGQVTERMIVFSALNTIYAVLALKVITGWVHMDLRSDWIAGISQPLYTLAGSVLLAALLYRAVAWVMRRLDMSDENTVLLLLGLLLLALAAARTLGLSTLLAPLLAGVMLRNATERPCIWPRHFGTAGGVLVLMLFVVAGSYWSVAAIATGAFAALAVLAARWIGKVLVLIAMARVSAIEERQGFALALALAPMSATTLVLLLDLQSSHPDLAVRLSPVVLSAVAAMAIIGPITVQWALRITGEHRRPDRRPDRGQP